MISQVQANQASAICDRMLALCEKTRLDLNVAQRICDGEIAKLEHRKTVTCSRCRLPVPVDALGKKDRCVDVGCPLNKQGEAQ